MSEEKIHPLVERLTVGLFPFGQENCGIATKIITQWLEERVREYEGAHRSFELRNSPKPILRGFLSINTPPAKRKVLKAQVLARDVVSNCSFVTDTLYTEQKAKEKFGTNLLEWPVGVQREMEVEG